MYRSTSCTWVRSKPPFFIEAPPVSEAHPVLSPLMHQAEFWWNLYAQPKRSSARQSYIGCMDQQSAYDEEDFTRNEHISEWELSVKENSVYAYAKNVCSIKEGENKNGHNAFSLQAVCVHSLFVSYQTFVRRRGSGSPFGYSTLRTLSGRMRTRMA